MSAKTYRHILIIRLSAMGDVAMTVPVIAQLRKDNPDLRITILTRPKFQPFFRDIPDVQFLTPDFEGAHKGFAGLRRLAREASAAGVDAVADLHDVLRTKILRTLLRLSGKCVAAVDKGRAGKRALSRKKHKIRVQLTPMWQRYLDTVRSLGLTVSEPAPARRAPRELSDALARMVGEKEGVWIGISPFSLHKGKIYPTASADALIGLLGERYSRVFIFGGGDHEREFAESMQRRHKNVVSLIGRAGLTDEMDMISNLDCMISMDSAAMHMASNLGTPVVSIWGATHPYAGFYGFGQNPEDAVQLDLDCRPCSVYGNRECRYKDYRCMQRIAPATVLEHVERLLARR